MIRNPKLASISILALGIYTSVNTFSQYVVSGFNPATTTSVLKNHIVSNQNTVPSLLNRKPGDVNLGLHMSMSPSSATTTTTPTTEEDAKEDIILETDSNGIYILKNKDDHM